MRFLGIDPKGDCKTKCDADLYDSSQISQQQKTDPLPVELWVTRHRKLVIGLNNMCKEFSLCLTKEQFNRNSDKFDALRPTVIVYRKDLNEIKDLSHYEELSTRLTEVYDKCYNSYEDRRLRFRSADSDTSDEGSLHPSNSVSQSKSNTSSKLL